MKLVMDEKIKHRLAGLAVVLSVAAIFAPALMKDNRHHAARKIVTVQHEPIANVKKVEIDITPETTEEMAVSTIAKLEPLQPSQSVKAVTISVHEKTGKTVQNTETMLLTANNERIVVNKPKVAIAKPAVKAKQTAKSIEAYTVQLGLFTQQTNAQALADKLKNKGYKVNIEKIPSKQGTFYKVLAGQFHQKQKALVLRQELASAMQINGFVVAAG